MLVTSSGGSSPAATARSTKAIAAVTVRRGAIATLPYRVVAATLGGDSARLTIAVRSRTGIVVRTLDLGVQPANVVRRATLRATWPKACTAGP